MIHKNTESAKVNFSKLEERLIQVNNFNFDNGLKLYEKKSSLIVATGGSKAAAVYLKMLFEYYGIVCEVIEPRDYFYKYNVGEYERLFVISNSGNSNGILDILNDFSNEKYLITGEYTEKETDSFRKIYWSNEKYLQDKEKSFVSIISTLGPMLMFLELSILINNGCAKLSYSEIKRINDELRKLIIKSREKVYNFDYDFKESDLIQVITGYDTLTSSLILESSLVETGSCGVILHDKGSYCHGRSNLIFQNPSSPMIYLGHKFSKLDEKILDLLEQEYPNVFLFDTMDEKDYNRFWQEFYLALQMYYLAEKIAGDRGIDLCMPEYNENVVRGLYRYRGRM